MGSRHLLLGVVGILLGALAAWQLGSGALIHARAWVGQALLEQAWARQQDGADPAPAWPGASTWPVARLEFPGKEVDRLVLEGSDGPSLAWGPGRMRRAAPVNGSGRVIIAAHRDTHFRFLEFVEPGEQAVLTDSAGGRRAWEVQSTRVVDSREKRLELDSADDRMTLVTCYPFNARRAGGPLRLLVELTPAGHPLATKL